MSLRLSVCRMMPCHVCGASSGDACGEVLCSATAIPLSRCLARLATMVDAGRARAKLDAAGGIVNMPRKQCGLRRVAMRSVSPACDKAQARNDNGRNLMGRRFAVAAIAAALL